MEFNPAEEPEGQVEIRERLDSYTVIQLDYFSSFSENSESPKRYTTEEKWLMNNCPAIQAEKFFSSYQDYNKDQEFLNQVWKGISTPNMPKCELVRLESSDLQPPWKVEMRKGIPSRAFNIVVLDIFGQKLKNNLKAYEVAVKVAFNGKRPGVLMGTPIFSEIRGFHNAVPVHFLNEWGMENLKNILWILEKNTLRLEYSPMLPNVVNILLMYLKPEDVYVVMNLLLKDSDRLLNIPEENSREKPTELRWHLTFKKEQFTWAVDHVTTFCKQRSLRLGKLDSHFTKIGFNYKEFYATLLRTFFLEFLPINLVLRIFSAYLNEGIKIVFKYICGFLRMYCSDILEHKNPATLVQMLQTKGQKTTLEQFENITSTAFKVRFGWIFREVMFPVNLAMETSNEKAIIYHPPEISDSSMIINVDQFETIWDWIPRSQKFPRLNLAYSTERDGWSLRTLYSKTYPCNGQASILLVRTLDDKIFGAFLDVSILLKKDVYQYSGSDHCFVFSLYPEAMKYNSMKGNKEHLLCDKDYISIGNGKDGAAIYLGNDLHRGFAYQSYTYNNQSLNGAQERHETHFESKIVEVYLLE